LLFERAWAELEAHEAVELILRVAGALDKLDRKQVAEGADLPLEASDGFAEAARACVLSE
jgi:hypothetical protein